MNPSDRSVLDFVATPRFEIVRHIGSGGMGSVFEAVDYELGTRVALKRLDGYEAEQLVRFKREFRDFQNLAHPNLVALRELFSDGSEWFFSMELLDGVNFLEYVRPSVNRCTTRSHADVDADTTTETATQTAGAPTDGPPRRSQRPPHLVRGPLDENRLRLALPQLARGIEALHDAGKLHCDIKPSNVLVTRDDRVVVLDYGIAENLHGSRTQRFIGTPAYMSPEQAACRRPSPAADWYAVGVVLFEALTGRRPHEGRTVQILHEKQACNGPSPRDVEPSAPSDLSTLCESLLKLDPAARPTGAEVLAQLGAESVSPPRSGQSTVFVGRTAQLAALDAAYRQSREHARLVLVTGESGIGKSALVQHFVDELKHNDPRVIVLTGTCYERESVPYKAFDGVIDALGDYLQSLHGMNTTRLIHEQIALVAHAFPVLWGSRAVRATGATELTRSTDPREQRSRLFGALRDVFRRMADAAPLVVAIDDLQWADADSRALLSELMAEPHAPRLLLVSTVRTDRAQDDGHDPLLLGTLVRDATLLRLESMLPDEARVLAEQLVRDSAGARDVNAEVIARVAEGHPLFVDALVRHAASLGDSSPPWTSLADALWARIAPLSHHARRILELVAMASGRIAQEAVGVAAGLLFSELSEHIASLRASHLLATFGSSPRDPVAPYHDQIRRAVLAHIDTATQRDHHKRLAEALEATGHIDPEALTVHWRECGELFKAAKFAKLAGDKAAIALAFDRAAAFYGHALALLSPSAPHEIARWSRQAFHVQHCNAMFAQVQAALYVGDAADARSRIERDWGNLKRAMLHRVQQIRVRATHFRACARVAVGDVAGALDDVRRLEREGAGWARALALLVRASLERTDPARAAATLRTAVSELDACDLGLYADAARRRLALVEGGGDASQRLHVADAALRARGVKDPARMAAMLAPDAPDSGRRR